MSSESTCLGCGEEDQGLTLWLETSIGGCCEDCLRDLINEKYSWRSPSDRKFNGRQLYSTDEINLISEGANQS